MALDLFGRDVFIGTCAQGGSWFACSTGTKFLGCCSNTADPCKDGCAQSDIEPVTFNADDYGGDELPMGSCPGGGGQAWTCLLEFETFNTTYWGCCQSDPCKQKGCPASDRLAASIVSPNQSTAFISSLATTTSASTSIPSSTTTSTATSTPTQGKKTNVAAIAGGAAGGVVALCLVIGLIVFLLRKRRARRNREDPDSPTEGMAFNKHNSSTYTDTPPLYQSPMSKNRTFASGSHLAEASSDYIAELETPPVGFVGRNPQRLSELSAKRSHEELDSAEVSPNPPQSPFAGHSRHHSALSELEGEGSPQTGVEEAKDKKRSSLSAVRTPGDAVTHSRDASRNGGSLGVFTEHIEDEEGRRDRTSHRTGK